MRDIVNTASVSPSPVLFIHIGTTPFCGAMGAAKLGRPGCCREEFVDPTYLEDGIFKTIQTIPLRWSMQALIFGDD
jgi:hypothetical protein